jgi:hypothetical protein
VAALDDTPHSVRRDVVLMADTSPEGLAIATALRTQGFAVATSSIERLEESVLEESPRVLIVDIDEPEAINVIARIRDLPEGGRSELVCLGDPARAAKVGATTTSGRAFARPVDIHAITAQIGALADPAPLDEEFLDDGLHDVNQRRPGESIAPFAGDGTGGFSSGYQSNYPSGPDVSEMGSSIFPPDETEGQSPTALLAAHPMQLSPELTELLANAEQKVMLADAFVSLPPVAHADDDSDIVLGEDYLSLLDSPIDSDDDAPGTGPEMAQTGVIDLNTGPVPIVSVPVPHATLGAPIVPETIPPVTSANISSIGGSPPVDTTPPVHGTVIGQAVVREPLKVREFVQDKLPISFADEASGPYVIPRPPPVAMEPRLSTSSTAVTVVEQMRPNRLDDSQLPTRRYEPSPVVASVKRPVPPILIDAGTDAQPPTVFPGRAPPASPKLDLAPLTSMSSPTTQPSMAVLPAPSTLNPPTVNPPTLSPPTAMPPSPQVPSSQPPTIVAPPTAPFPQIAVQTNSTAIAPPTAKPLSPKRDFSPAPLRPFAPPLPPLPPPVSQASSPPSSVPSSPRPTKPTPLLPPPNVRRNEPVSSVRLAPPVPPPPAPVIVTGTSNQNLEATLQNDKPTVLAPGDAPRALARAIASRVTGSLALHSQGNVRRVVLQEGDVVTAGSGVAEESLVAFLAARGEIERDVATRLASKLPPGGRHAGAALIAHGYLSQDALWSVLRAHAEWIIGGFLLIDSGTLELESEAPGRLRAEPSVFGGSMGAEVFVDAVRRVISPDVALARLGGSAARIDGGSRFTLLAECALRPDEQGLMHEAAGATIAELITRSSTELSPLLYALVCLEVLSVLVPSRRVEKSQRAPHDPLDQEAIRMRVRARLALVEEGDYFAVLGVPRGATSYEIRRAFIDLRRSFEPSRLLTAETADLANDVRTVLEVLDEAYEILKDTHRRERYRRAIEAGPA